MGYNAEASEQQSVLDKEKYEKDQPNKKVKAKARVGQTKEE